ncbi:MFS transporter [Streptomyces sp. NBC_01306]|uniref:MFS transporter n=1 Tax=Streptomyces sp. NBC_01306 TaxID=2903819 RepID=UPI0022526A24|nr:MFS transporter [Streptomyces sp. NBC_01306]MCX4728819.1 MFS transporter [Streptomyces sp. NBC_01306]
MTIDQHAAAGAAPRRGTPAVGPAVSRRAWAVLTVLLLLMLANFADKVVVGVAGVDIMREVRLSPDRFGVIQSSFFCLFAVGSITGGWLGGKVKARWLLGGIALLWAVSLAPMAGQVGFTAIVACRVLLGFAEGPTTALAMQATHSWFPAHKRTVPSSLVVAGAGIGPVVAAPLATWMITSYSWHAAFGALAVVGVVAAALWLAVGRDGPLAHDDGGEVMATDTLPEHVPLRRLFGTGTLVGLMLLLLVTYAGTAVMISWLPLYLRDGLGYGANATGRLTALPFLGTVVSVILVGFASRAMSKRGASNRAARGILPGCLVLAGGLATIAFPLVGPRGMEMALIILSTSLSASSYGVAFAGLADVVPAKQRSTVFGIVTAFYSLGAIVAPIVIGKLVGASEKAADGYGHGFMMLGAAMVLGGLAVVLLTNPDRDAAKLAGHAQIG